MLLLLMPMLLLLLPVYTSSCLALLILMLLYTVINTKASLLKVIGPHILCFLQKIFCDLTKNVNKYHGFHYSAEANSELTVREDFGGKNYTDRLLKKNLS